MLCAVTATAAAGTVRDFGYRSVFELLPVRICSHIRATAGMQDGGANIGPTLAQPRLHLLADQLQRVHDPFVRHQPAVIQLAEDAGEAQLLL